MGLTISRGIAVDGTGNVWGRQLRRPARTGVLQDQVLAPPANAAVFAVDEKPHIQALEPNVPRADLLAAVDQLLQDQPGRMLVVHQAIAGRAGLGRPT